MKIRFDKTLKKLDGTKLYIQTIENDKAVDTKEEFQLKDACVNSLLAEIEGEKIDGNEKLRRYLLATKIQKANELDLKSEEIVKIKELIGKVYGVLVVGQSYALLENKK